MFTLSKQQAYDFGVVVRDRRLDREHNHRDRRAFFR